MIFLGTNSHFLKATFIRRIFSSMNLRNLCIFLSTIQCTTVLTIKKKSIVDYIHSILFMVCYSFSFSLFSFLFVFHSLFVLNVTNVDAQYILQTTTINCNTKLYYILHTTHTHTHTHTHTPVLRSGEHNLMNVE